jgi:hypothetical protein
VNKTLTVSLNDAKVGTLIEARGAVFFEYDSGFLASGVELSPLHLTIGPGLRSRSGVPQLRLPGV